MRPFSTPENSATILAPARADTSPALPRAWMACADRGRLLVPEFAALSARSDAYSTAARRSASSPHSRAGPDCVPRPTDAACIGHARLPACTSPDASQRELCRLRAPQHAYVRQEILPALLRSVLRFVRGAAPRKMLLA